VSTGLWKALTGGDPIECEAKGQMSFTAKLQTKFIVLSQKRPQISSERADQRRLIYCELTGSWDDLTPEEMATFEARLWDEGGAFLTHCLGAYHQRYPHGGPIKSVMTQEMEGWVSSLEEEFEVFFAHYFIIDQAKKDYWVSPATLQEVMVGTFKHRARCIEWLEWLERKHRVRKCSVKLAGGKVIQSYKGLILKSQSGAV
jgi:hypothetical protein